MWLDLFNTRLGQWIASERTDTTAAAEFADALRHLLERAPEYGTMVATLATNLLHQNAGVLQPSLAAELAEVGLSAERVVSDRRPTTRAWLTVERGRAALADGRYLDGARDAQAALEALTAEGELEGFVRAKALALGGSSLDALLDHAAARVMYRDAGHVSGGLVEDQARLAALVGEVLLHLFGEQGGIPGEAIDAELQLLWRELGEVRIAAAVGAARCALFTAPDELGPALEEARAVLTTHGLAGASPFELAVLVRGVPDPEAGEFADEVVALADGLGLESAAFAAVLYAAAACVADEPAVGRFVVQAGDALVEVDDLLIWAAALGFLFVAAASGRTGDVGPARDLFLDGLELVGGTRDARLDDPRVRTAFDEPVALALRALVDAVDEPPGSSSRIQLAGLIDFEFGNRSQLDRWLPTTAPDELLGTEVELAALLAHDRVARLQRALRDWPGATALILRSAGRSLLLFAFSTDGTVTVAEADEAYRDAADGLVSLLDDEIAALELTGVAADEETFVNLGSAAYDALPDEIKQKLDASDVILVCPDHRTGGDAVPYELFHDGNGWLGTEKVVARFPSLRALVRSCEGTARRDTHGRLLALSVADPERDGYPPLQLADREVADVRGALAARGWDAPSIEPERITAGFVLDRMPFVTHMHLAAHGDVEESEDELLLAGGDTLTSTDLAARFFPRVPSAYVNACSVATTRWVGGGKSRGVAQALFEAGSPAVVANLLPVEDTHSSMLASSFYEAAESVDMGEALRQARAELQPSSSPLLWSSTVLIGDPRARLAPDQPTPSLSEQLLEAMFVGEGGTGREEIRAQAMEALATDPDDVRLAAAVALMQEVAAWGAEPDRDLRGRVAAACRVAVELDYLPAAALIAFILVETYGDDDDPGELMELLEGVIDLVEPLEHDAQLWTSLLDRLLVRWMLLRAGDRAPSINVRGAESEEEDELRVLGEAIRDAQLAQEARAIRQGHSTSAREAEETVEDVLWNAVQANRVLQLESMPEIASFAAQVADKLAQLDAISDASRPYARTAIAGVLKWLWDSQNVVQLAPELAEGQAGTMAQLLGSIKAHWPPGAAPWFEEVGGFGESVETALASLEGLPYDDQLYPAIGVVMEQIEGEAHARLDAVAAEHPDRQPDAMAWVLGVLIERNRYSWTEGSVPEDLQARLEQIHGRIGSSAEATFFPWLMSGFQTVREAKLDELDRWRFGLEAG